MPYCSYQGIIPVPPPLSTSTISGGNITQGGTYYFWLQIRNRAGYSLVSSVRSVVFTAGQIIQLVVPSLARPSPDNGTYPYEFVVLGNTANNPATATVIASYPGYETDDLTETTLPGLIQLSEDEHLALSEGLSFLSELSSIPNPIHGMRRLVDEDDLNPPTVTFNKIVFYSEVGIPGWYVAQDQVFSTYVSSTSGTMGAIADVFNVQDGLVIAPSYSLSTDPGIRSPSTAVGYWLINDTSSTIKSGTRVALTVSIGDTDISSEVTGRIIVVFRGYVDITTGILDRGDGSGGTMAVVDVELDYAGDQIQVIGLPKDLPAGSACWFDVYAVMTLAELNNRAPIGSSLRFAFAFFAYRSIPSSPVSLFGSFIAAQFDRRLLVPTLGMGLKALNGSGKVSFEGIGTAFDFWNVGEQTIGTLEANTPDQAVYITKEGTCLPMDSPTSTVLLRAEIGTVDGIGEATAWSSPIALNGSQNLRITVTYPTQIRSNYPDANLSGSDKGEFNGYGLRIWVRPVGGSSSYYDVVITPESLSDIFVIGASAGTSAEPVAPVDPYFGLFQVPDDGFSLSLLTQTSSLAAGNYTVAISLRYFGNVTKIRHDLLDAIHTFDSSVQEVWERSEYWRTVAETPVSLRTWAQERTPGMRVGLLHSPDIFYWDQDSLEADDGSDTIQITGVATGRFVRLKTAPLIEAGNGISVSSSGNTITISSAPKSLAGYLTGFGLFTYSS